MSREDLARVRRAGPIEPGERKQGLGLPLARQLVEAHGGQLEILSRLGEGTTVTITLP